MSELSKSCDEVRSDIPLFAGGDLDEPVARAMAAHVDACSACRNEVEAAQAARAALGALRVEGREPDLWPGVRDRLIAGGHLGADGRLVRPSAHPVHQLEPVGRQHKPVGRGSSWLKIGGLAAAGLMLGLFLWHGSTGTGTLDPERSGGVLSDGALSEGAVSESGLSEGVMSVSPAVDRPTSGGGLGSASSGGLGSTSSGGGLRLVGLDEATLSEEAAPVEAQRPSGWWPYMRLQPNMQGRPDLAGQKNIR